MAFALQIDSGHSRADYGQSFHLSSAIEASLAVASLLHLLPNLSEHVRPGWLYVESSLGECYKSLANVQLPSRSHAE